MVSRRKNGILLLCLFVALFIVLAWTTPGAAQSGIRFAVIGDYGTAGPGAAAVAEMVKSWNPDFIITTGDNNYPNGAAETIDQNIGQFYHDYISPYVGNYGSGASENRFFPTLGNHDWETAVAQPYLDYFTLPGNERYYDFVRGPVHFFALDANYSEPDGIASTSVQANWLQTRLAASTARWKLVYMHVPPYSSGEHGSTPALRWPFQEWGATTVIAGHEHTYERLLINGFPYFVNGLGGDARYAFVDSIPGSEVRFNAASGAMLVEANSTSITFEFFSVSNGGTLIDSYTLTAQ